jgi:hypothetical protein
VTREDQFTICCSACGKPAATIGFTPEAQLGLTLGRSGFLGSVSAAVLGREDITPELFSRVRNLAKDGDFAALAGIDRDFFGFICVRCTAPYCGDCWKDVYVTFDDGFYDETRGTCPQGHEQMLDD